MTTRFAGCLIAVALIGSPSFVQHSIAEDAPSEADIEQLVRELDANKFEDRQAASQELADAGEAALDAIEEAAMSDSREVRVRALEILTDHFNGSDEALKKSAKERLERLSKVDAPAVANRAKQIIDPPKPAAPQFAPGNRIILGNAQIQIRNGGGVQRIQMQNNNGVKEIKAEENGMKVKITDDPKNGIKMEVTEKKDGKETTKKYEAKNADDLKKQHPDAHKLYEKYSKGPANIQIQAIQGMQRIQIKPGQLPAMPALPVVPGQQILPQRLRVIRPNDAKQIDDAIKEATDNLQKLHGDLKELSKDSNDKEAIEAAIKSIEEAQSQIESIKEKVGG